ncbi:unnamed protein product [Paramecium octaurelia]|uniref:Uncharacterized protein n=1 Tax=Paramecium octaurelia TaxID=43137 RepID=A0A8S1Y120_PAROT|nr:unnamed protein product [Paramecium octaurelia]
MLYPLLDGSVRSKSAVIFRISSPNLNSSEQNLKVVIRNTKYVIKTLASDESSFIHPDMANFNPTQSTSKFS